MNTQILVQPKVQGDKITIEISKKILEKLLGYKKKNIYITQKKTNWTEIKKLKGAWKNMKIDPLKYENKIRNEWNREYSK
ncbi:hypothetical protein KAI65_04255 [Candidatus Parcubacteria bacterium]|nr:hypothetical protein [Candidatus Parcubacteria bacterium]